MLFAYYFLQMQFLIATSMFLNKRKHILFFSLTLLSLLYLQKKNKAVKR